MSVEIEKLKKLKAPLWSQWLGSWRARRRAYTARKHKHHIASIALWARNTKGVKSTCWIHLFQTGEGTKSFNYENPSTQFGLKEWNTYHRYVVPWMHGRVSNKEIGRIAEATLREPTSWEGG